MNAIVSLISMLAAIATAYTAYLVYKQVQIMNSTIIQSQKDKEVSILLEISKRFREIFPIRNKLMASDISWEQLIKKYGDFAGIKSSTEWQEFTEVAIFYDLIGMLIKQKYFDPELINELLSIKPGVWEKFENIIFEVRKETPEFLSNWDYMTNEIKLNYEMKPQSK